MDGIDKILQRLEEDAAAEIEAILSDGQAQVNAIAASYKEKAAAEYSAMVEKGRAVAAEREKRLNSMADLEARKLLLTEKQAGIDAAFELARKKMFQLSREQRIRLYARLASSFAITGRESIIMTPQERLEIGAEVVEAANQLRELSAFTLSRKTAATGGGLILSSDKMDVNCTFDAIFRLLRDDLAGEIGQMLYE